MINQNRFRRLSVILFFLTLIVLVIHLESLIRFNKHEFNIHGNDSRGNVQMEIDARKDSTSTWLKRSFQMNDGRHVNLIGQTIDGTLLNQSRDIIQDWELRINIVGDCFINQAWNGEVEIHQFTGTDKEKVQRLNLQDYQLEDVIFEYRYDGDLLIPLQQGDYVIYFPSTRFSEMPIRGGEDVKIGVIFYYLDELDLSDYDVLYHFYRSFTQGITFYVFVVVVVLWILMMTITGAGTLAYRRALKEMELRKSGISSMSDIYDLIYIIHLPTGEMTPVSVVDKIERDRPKNRTAKELLTDLIMQDSEEKYRDRMLAFVDTDTLAERLKDRNSIASEYLSSKYGWCSIRFFAMDRVEGKPLENVIFAVQDIREEKKEQEAIIQQIEEAESINKAKVSFMDNIEGDLQRPLQTLTELNGRILRECRDEAVRGCARTAFSTANRIRMLIDGLADSFDVESGRLRLAAEPYSLGEVLIDTLRTIVPLAEQNGFDVTLDVAETLPDRLQGDPRMLRELLVNMISGTLTRADGGKVHLSVYGKILDENVHLLFTVCVLSDSVDLVEASGLGLEVVSALLIVMDSTLKSVRSPGGRREVYFEIEQRVLNAEPIGKLTVPGAEE